MFKSSTFSKILNSAIKVNKDNILIEDVINNTQQYFDPNTWPNPIEITNCCFSECSSSGSHNNGGALCVDYEFSTLTASSTIFIRCHCSMEGGAIYSIGDNINLQDVIFSENQAGKSGAAVYNNYQITKGHPKTNINETLVSGNTSPYSPMNIYTLYDNLCTHSNFTNNRNTQSNDQSSVSQNCAAFCLCVADQGQKSRLEFINLVGNDGDFLVDLRPCADNNKIGNLNVINNVNLNFFFRYAAPTSVSSDSAVYKNIAFFGNKPKSNHILISNTESNNLFILKNCFCDWKQSDVSLIMNGYSIEDASFDNVNVVTFEQNDNFVRPTRCIIQTDPFTKSSTFSNSEFFSNSLTFSFSEQFSNSKIFSSSDAFSSSSIFSKSEKFTLSNFFTRSSTFSMSAQFSKSVVFSPSEKFSSSELFSKSAAFSRSDKFSLSSEFSHSSQFSESSEFSKSSIFSRSEKFSSSTGFTKSFDFSASTQFQPSSEFTKSSSFPSSHFFLRIFSMSSEFSESSQFSESSIFSLSSSLTGTFEFGFAPTTQFTESATFSSSSAFSMKSTQTFSPSNPFTPSFTFSPARTKPPDPKDIFDNNAKVSGRTKGGSFSKEELKSAAAPASLSFIIIIVCIVLTVFYLRRKLKEIRNLDNVPDFDSSLSDDNDDSESEYSYSYYTYSCVYSDDYSNSSYESVDKSGNEGIFSGDDDDQYTDFTDDEYEFYDEESLS